MNGLDPTNFLLVLENLNLSFLAQKKELDEITLKVKKSKVSAVQNVKHLDVVLEKFPYWCAQVNNLCVKLAQINGFLSKSSHYVPQNTCILIYFSLFYSYPQHGNLVQKRISKTSLHLAKEMFTHNYVFFSHFNSLFKDLQLLKLPVILELEVIKFFYTFSRNKLPKSVCSQFNVVHEFQVHLLRGNSASL